MQPTIPYPETPYGITYNFDFLNLDYFFYKIWQLLSLRALLDIYGWLMWLADLLRPYMLVLCLLLLTGIIYCILRIRQIDQEEEWKLAQNAMISHAPSGNSRWQKILDNIESGDENNRRLAILECDIILDEMLEKMGYHGETVGEKLKSVEPSDFTSLDKAWEAHKIRNMIAHEGANFSITEREARRVVGLYKDVFEEFHFI
jgi:hypothetical protein